MVKIKLKSNSFSLQLCASCSSIPCILINIRPFSSSRNLSPFSTSLLIPSWTLAHFCLLTASVPHSFFSLLLFVSLLSWITILIRSLLSINSTCIC
jgi:thiosulfate reductase cytochrome b subunit